LLLDPGKEWVNGQEEARSYANELTSWQSFEKDPTLNNTILMIKFQSMNRRVDFHTIPMQMSRTVHLTRKHLRRSYLLTLADLEVLHLQSKYKS
jgi:hypothetical protein